MAQLRLVDRIRAAAPGWSSGPSAAFGARRAGRRRAGGSARLRGDLRLLSNVRGVRLLWEEDALDAIGAFCVGAFVLGATWMLLEGLLGASALLSGTIAIFAAVWTLGEISRQRYPQRRSYASRHMPAAALAGTRPRRAEGVGEPEDESAGRASGSAPSRARRAA